MLAAAFQSGHPESIVDRVIINDTAALTNFKKCVLTAAGVVSMDGTLNRMGIIMKMQTKATIHPLLMDVVAAAINSCPEPENLKVAQFMTCVKKACIHEMPDSIVALPSYGAFGMGAKDDDDHKKCKKGKKGKGCKKH
ncbi:hypothetical protein SK128_014448 [Halocaridina rubra]|uniref:Uncharacterized protein n=1 Tax=Halocaridina rubra TaxID=373956 RepID=A0AAN8WHE8_HALRR